SNSASIYFGLEFGAGAGFVSATIATIGPIIEWRIEQLPDRTLGVGGGRPDLFRNTVAVSPILVGRASGMIHTARAAESARSDRPRLWALSQNFCAETRACVTRCLGGPRMELLCWWQFARRPQLPLLDHMHELDPGFIQPPAGAKRPLLLRSWRSSSASSGRYVMT